MTADTAPGAVIHHPQESTGGKRGWQALHANWEGGPRVRDIECAGLGTYYLLLFFRPQIRHRQSTCNAVAMKVKCDAPPTS